MKFIRTDIQRNMVGCIFKMKNGDEVFWKRNDILSRLPRAIAVLPPVEVMELRKGINALKQWMDNNPESLAPSKINVQPLANENDKKRAWWKIW